MRLDKTWGSNPFRSGFRHNEKPELRTGAWHQFFPAVGWSQPFLGGLEPRLDAPVGGTWPQQANLMDSCWSGPGAWSSGNPDQVDASGTLDHTPAPAIPQRPRCGLCSS